MKRAMLVHDVRGRAGLQLSPAGDVLQGFPVPAMCPTVPCFGAAVLKTLFLRTARDKRQKKVLEQFPESG